MPAGPGSPKGGNPSPDPFLNFNYIVEIAGIIEAGFHEVSGLDSTIDVVEHREGGQNTTTMKIPGQTKYSNIVLKRGLYDGMELYNWHKAVIEGPAPAARKDGSIVLYDRQGKEVSRWTFYRAWPTKYSGPSLSAQGHDVAIESLELAHEGIERVK